MYWNLNSEDQLPLVSMLDKSPTMIQQMEPSSKSVKSLSEE
jgi:hypothetical protein